MNTTLRSTTLIALAAGAFAADTVAPPAQVPVVPLFKDSNLKLTIGGQFQFRADYSQARTAADQPFDVATNTANKSDDIDFYLRRCRLFIKGAYGDYSINFGIRADNADRKSNSPTDYNSTASGSGRAFEIHYASITRQWKGDINHSLQIGLDYAFFNSASYGNSSAALIPAARASETLLAPRGAGIGYRLDAGPIYFGADVQNNTRTLNGNGDDAAASSVYQSEGLCYTSRLEFSPVGDWSIKPKDFKETYAGKAGKGWMIGLEAGYNAHDTEGLAGGRAVWKDTLALGIESLLHADSLTALIEYRWLRQTINTDAGEPDTSNITPNPQYASVFVVQAGYTIPCPLVSGAIIEPVARYTNMDYNHASGKATDNFGFNDYAAYTLTYDASGNQYDLGLNWYPAVGVYNNKVSLLWTHWIGESADAGTIATNNYKPKADIVRVQYQWLF